MKYTLACLTTLWWMIPMAMTPVMAQQSIADTAAGDKSLSAFVQAFKTAGLEDLLKGSEKMTVLVPNDAAFKAAGDLPTDKAKLKAILDLHVIKGSFNLGAAMVAGKVSSVAGVDHKVGLDGGSIKMGAGTVIKANVECRNGYIHIIDQVFVPTPKGIIDVARAAGNLNMFITALDAAGLMNELKKDGPFTVFAPTDAAFALVAGELLLPSNKETLIKTLKHHVVPGKVGLADLLSSKEYTSLAGAPLSGGLDTGSIAVNGITVSQPNVEAENGIIHLIDGVLIPKPKTPAHFAIELIEQSIKVGGALYNGKNPTACVDVYKMTIHALSTLNPDAITTAVIDDLSTASEKAAVEKDDAARAWALRQGLDAARHRLKATIK